ncbi:THUMP-like domain-containing protein [Luteococcus sp. OSA5]|uniref:THUMP-like domain-containing protein n=1 Tax=Luteococcus sp. OSA5 TaxID=3401630 RepID=UPI003B4368DB
MSLLHTPEGQQALAAAMGEQDPASLSAATRLRKAHAPDLAAEALAQVALRRKARAKFGPLADELYFTADALEQATRPVVSTWRAQRLRDEGITRVIDLGCGIGADSLACLRAGIDVVAVELDETTAEHARANLATGLPLDKLGERGFEVSVIPAGEPVEAPTGSVIHGDAVALAPELLSGAGPETCVFIDPARRTESGRTWQVEAFTPPWDFVLSLLDGPHSTVVKLGPGVPKQILPEGVEALWVADGHDVVECSLWSTPHAGCAQGAVLLDARAPDTQFRLDRTDRASLPVGPVGSYLLEPHGAVIRAGALDRIDASAWLLDEHVAYLCTDEPINSPFATCFEVLEDLDFNPKTLKAWVRERRIGTLEIKKRALDVEPAQLRRKLQPKGPNSATVVLARTQEGTRALVVRRLMD